MGQSGVSGLDRRQARQIGRWLLMQLRRLALVFRHLAVVLQGRIPKAVFDRPNRRLSTVPRIGLAQNGFQVNLLTVASEI